MLNSDIWYEIMLYTSLDLPALSLVCKATYNTFIKNKHILCTYYNYRLSAFQHILLLLSLSLITDIVHILNYIFIFLK